MIKATIDTYEWALQTCDQTTCWLATRGFNVALDRWDIASLPDGDVRTDVITYFVDEARDTVTFVQAR
jgi:hypothetical protein